MVSVQLTEFLKISYFSMFSINSSIGSQTAGFAV